MGTEHFCTLFDEKFLPSGLALHESLVSQAGRFHLWILCMDVAVESQLRALALPHVTLIPLAELETSRLLAVKSGRSKGEYCWTLTPFLPAFVLGRDPLITRVTYLDADLYFFGPPGSLLEELPASAHALITEHAYDPRHDQTATAGRFCVQFLCFRNSEVAREIMGWWQERCLEWCFARHEDGKFGDQKYLDQWPALFGERVHILLRKEDALAPWNADYYLEGREPALRPVFFHFHGLRLISEHRVRLFTGYHIGPAGDALYREYQRALGRAVARMRAAGFRIPFFPEEGGALNWLRALRLKLRGRRATAGL